MDTATIFYTKRFASGILKGISVNCQISMPNTTDSIARYAKLFHTGRKGRDLITNDRYIITDASFQNYVR